MGWIVNGKYVPDIIRSREDLVDRNVCIDPRRNNINNELFDDFGITIEKKYKKDANLESSFPQRIYDYDDSDFINNIRYADNVANEEKIPGLIAFLEEERGKIIRFFNTLFSNYRFSNDFNTEWLWDIPIILCKETPTKQYTITKTDERLEKEINDVYITTEDRNEIRSKVIKILQSKSRSYTQRILGMYFHKGQRHIELYYRNINEADQEVYKATIANTLAHELFHAIHHLLIGKKFEYVGDINERVKEATAEFFAFEYSWKQGGIAQKVAEDRFNTWADRISDGWLPYAFAICFFDDYEINLQNIGKFIEVVMESKNGAMQDAYDIMIR